MYSRPRFLICVLLRESAVPPKDGTGPVLAAFLFSSPPGESMVPQGLRRTQPPTPPRSSKMMLGKWHASNAVVCVILLQSSFLGLFGLFKRLKLECAFANAFRVKYAPAG